MVRQKKQYRKQYRKLRNLIAINNPRQMRKIWRGIDHTPYKKGVISI